MEADVVCDYSRIYSSVSPAAPVTCFKHVPLIDFWNESSFIGIVVELPNDLCKKAPKQKFSALLNGKDAKTQLSQPPNGKTSDDLDREYFFATVIEMTGYRARMRYLGGESDTHHDFWCNICSSCVHHIGWAAANGRKLAPPSHVRERDDWGTFLVERMTGAATLPLDFSTRVWSAVRKANMWPMRKGMRVEVADRTCLGRMKRAVVDKVVGGRLRLKYVTSQIAGDYFWCHRLSNLLHHVGWSQKVGHSLEASAGYKETSYMKAMTGSYETLDASESMFPKVPAVHTPFSKGMAVEAVDPLNLSQICIATVERILNHNYVMLGFDEMATSVAAASGSRAAADQLRASEALVGVVTGAKRGGEEKGRKSEISQVCYHAASPYILPPGFCREHGIKLTLPSDLSSYQSDESFIWEQPAVKTNSYNPAPAHLFTYDIPDHGFVEGMKVEAADLMEPRLICLATVTAVKSRLIRVHFDGWDESYDQWMDCESPDVFPIGWCELLGHPIEALPEHSMNQKMKKAFKGKKRRRRVKAQKSSSATTVTSTLSNESVNTEMLSADDDEDDDDDESMVIPGECTPPRAHESSGEPPMLSDPASEGKTPAEQSSTDPPVLSDQARSTGSGSSNICNSSEWSEGPPSLSDPILSLSSRGSSTDLPVLSDQAQRSSSGTNADTSGDPPPLADTSAPLGLDVSVMSTSSEDMPELSPVPFSVVQRSSFMKP